MAGFDQDKYKKIFEARYGSGSYESGLSNARKTGQLQAQAKIAKSQYDARRKEAEDKAKKKDYLDATNDWKTDNSLFKISPTDDPDKLANEIRNDPWKQEQIKKSGYAVDEYINGMYSAWSDGRYRSEREYKQANSAREKRTGMSREDTNNLPKTEYAKSQDVAKEKKSQPKKETKKNSNPLSKLKDFLTSKDTNGDGDRDGLLGAVDRFVVPISKGATDLFIPGNTEAMKANEVKYNKKENPVTKAALKDRGVETKVLNTVGAGLATLAPYSKAYKAADLAVNKIPSLARIANPYAQRAIKGAISGGLAEGGISAINELSNPEAKNIKDYRNQIGLGVLGGAVLDPALYGAGKLATKGIYKGLEKLPQNALNRIIPGDLPKYNGQLPTSLSDSIQPTSRYAKGNISEIPSVSGYKPSLKTDLSPNRFNMPDGQNVRMNQADIKSPLNQLNSQMSKLKPKVESYKQEFDTAVEQQYQYLKNSMGKGVDTGTTSNGLGGNFREVTGRYTVSNNPKWYQDFYAQTGRKPNDSELRSLAQEHVRNGFQDEVGSLPAWKPQAVTEIDDQIDELVSLVRQDPSQEQAVRPILEALDKDRYSIMSTIDNGLSEYNSLQSRLSTLKNNRVQEPSVLDAAPRQEPSLDRLKTLGQQQSNNLDSVPRQSVKQSELFTDEGLLTEDEVRRILNGDNYQLTESQPPYFDRLRDIGQQPTPNRLQAGRDFEPMEPAPKGMSEETVQPEPKLSRVVEEGQYLDNGDKIRKHITTLKESPNTTDELSERLFSTYTPTTNQEAVDIANELVSEDIEKAVSFVKNAKVFKPQHVATGHRLIQEFQKAGDIERAVDIAEYISKQGTKYGQTVQSFSIYDKLSPEGILVHANRIADRVNARLGPNAKKSVVTPEMANQLTDLSQTAQKLTGQTKAANDVISLMDKVKEGATLTGDEIKSIRQFADDMKQFTGNLTPNKAKKLTGTMGEAEKAINKAVNGGKIDAPEAENLRKLADEIGKMSGDAKDEASQELQALLQNLEKPTFLEKVSAAQTISQLLNPKTQVRNALGNEMFYRLERLNKLVSTPIDWATSKLTGKERTITFKTNNQGEYWKNWIKGAKAGWKGVNPEGLTTQYDLRPNVFSNKWNPLTYMQKALGTSLKSFDYAGYKRAVNNTVGEMATLRAMNDGLTGEAQKMAIQKYIREADENVLMIADQYGKYATFQDNNLLSVGLQKFKNGLNLGKEFGMGDLIIKYPRTPGSLLARALEYSPAGFLRTAYQIATPILKQGEKVATRDVIEGLTRALIGTAGISSISWFLADKGILTGTGSKDYDTADLERQAGKADYSVNMTALTRWVVNGFDPKAAETQKGDQFISYNWAQPIATGISLGTNMNYNQKTTGKTDVPQLVMGAVDSVLDTMVEQSVLQGVKKAFTSYPGQSVGDKLTDIAGTLPSSFVPTAFNQVRQYSDNTSRSTYDPSKLKKFFNQAQNKIPGAASSLPKAYDTLGNQKEVYQNDSNNLFNVFLNPAFVKTYNPSPEAQMVMNVIDETGDTSVAPRSAQKYLIIDGERLDLTPEQYSEYQRRLGTEVKTRLSKLTPLEKVSNKEVLGKKINKILDDSGRKVRNELKKEYK